MAKHLLSLIIFLPLVFALFVLLLPNTQKSKYKYITLTSTVIQVIFSLVVFQRFRQSAAISGNVWNEINFQFVEKLSWIELNLGSLGTVSIDYFLGIDGMSLSMVLL